MQQGRLIVTEGLLGSGRGSLAQSLANGLGAPVLAVDPIEAAMWRSQFPAHVTGIAAYEVAAAMAEENLRLGLTVIVDAVNPVEAARATWVRLAERQMSSLVFVECYCSDADLHRKRIENRVRGIAGMPEITWERVEERRAGYGPWSMERVRLDTAKDFPESLAGRVLKHMAGE